MYQLRFKDNSQPLFTVTGKMCTVGRAPDNSLVLPTSTVSDSHAKLIQHEGRLFLQDNKSTYGCFVNGTKVKYKELKAGDVITVGNVHFDIIEAEDPSLAATHTLKAFTLAPGTGWRLVSDSSWLSGKIFELPEGKTILGRGKDCNIIIPGTHLSRHHAELVREEKRLVLRDLDSANGSFINENRINGPAVLKAGDRLRFDVYSFRVYGPAEAEAIAPVAPVVVDTSGPRRIPNLENTLQNIEALKAQEYQPKEWITKPTSHGNRYHEVPSRNGHHAMLWFSVILGIGVLGVLGYIVFSL
ncbi:MAG TPA: FHA domain-containing protein [Pseudomonadales bacterium]|nr:FHA domain-containing protein [Pseudomonadales bacterium]